MKRAILKKTAIPAQVWWIVIAVLLIVIIFQVRGVWERYTVEREMLERRVEAEETLLELQVKKDTLETQVQYMTNERGIEEELRQNFDVALPGERVFILTGETAEEVEVGQASTASSTEQASWFRFW